MGAPPKEDMPIEEPSEETLAKYREVCKSIVEYDIDATNNTIVFILTSIGLPAELYQMSMMAHG